MASLFPCLYEDYALGQGYIRTQHFPLFQLSIFGGLLFLSALAALGPCQAPVGGGVRQDSLSHTELLTTGHLL